MQNVSRFCRVVGSLLAAPSIVACSVDHVSSPTRTSEAGTSGPLPAASPADACAAQANCEAAAASNAPEDAAVACPSRAHGRLSVRVSLSNGSTYDCSLAGAPDAGGPVYKADLAITGTVTLFEKRIGDGGGPTWHIDINTCSSSNGCTTELVQLDIGTTISTPDINIPVGTLVAVDYHLGVSFGCGQSVAINQIGPQGRAGDSGALDNGLLLWASDGFIPGSVSEVVMSAQADAQPNIYVARELDSCGTVTSGCGAIPVADYALKFFQDVYKPDTGVTVRMGYPATAWSISGHAVNIVNLRSYQTNICDDYWNWSYWMSAM